MDYNVSITNNDTKDKASYPMMTRNTRLANVIDSVDTLAKYDNSVKALLANKSILAWILKCCVCEFAEYDLQTIAECIEGTPEIGTRSVHSNESDIMLDGNEEIVGSNTEDNSVTESRITYDIRFEVMVPDTDNLMEMLINIEVQNNEPGYPLEKRVIYYLCRMISRQYGSTFKKSHYEKIEKVYSIWICTGSPGYKKNTISQISLQSTAVFGNASLNPSAVDLMQGMIIHVGNPEDEVDNDILRLFNMLLAKTVPAEEKKKVLEEDFSIKMTEELEREVSDMCNLSLGILYEGIEQGKAEKQKSMALSLYQQGVDISIIAKAAEVTVEIVKSWLEPHLATE